jgi:release factor glutamine methyltransferase
MGMLSEPTIRIDDKILERILAAIAAPSSVYSPAEDSFLMLNALSTILLEKKKVLDMGTGSGIQGLYCAMRGASVTSADTDETALLCAQEAAHTLGISLNAVLSDLFSNIGGRFDVVLFNPPYLPSSTLEDRTVDGGKKGSELTSRFLEALPRHVTNGGIALLLLSSQNDPHSIIADHPEFDFSVVAKRALFFEELQVLRLRFPRNVVR